MTRLNDYRNRTKKSVFEKKEIQNKKSTLLSLLDSNNKIKNHYNYIKYNPKIRIKFLDIYNKHCSYCGVNGEVVQIERFEIDHIIPNECNHLSNLTVACHTCNNKKSNIFIPEVLKDRFHPDGDLGKYYIRNHDFSIIPSNQGNIEFINLFYDKLKLSYEFRRLDFLIMEIMDLIDTGNICDSIKVKLYEIVRTLKNKRHIAVFYKT